MRTRVSRLASFACTTLCAALVVCATTIGSPVFAQRAKPTVVPAPGRRPWARDLSTMRPAFTGNLISWTPPAAASLHFTLTLDTDRGQTITCSPQYGSGSTRVILDEPEARRVVLMYGKSRRSVELLLNRAVSEHLDVQLFGQEIAGGCSPELIWAAAAGARR